VSADDVLVVDDSAVDRRLAGRLLERRGFGVRYAAGGAEALTEIARARPAIVLTDLDMPGLDGLELVAAVRREHPNLPVVLMTALGSEGLSVTALRAGAASFVPKRRLAADLADTLRAILELAAGAQGRTSAVDPLGVHELEIVLDNDVALLPDVVGQLEADLARLGCDETEVIQIGVALREALVNAIQHGNLELGSELLDVDGAAFDERARARRAEPPYAARRVRVVARYDRGEIAYTITDDGPGFDPSALPDPTDPANLERVHGRGLLLIRTFMDEVVHGGRGNVLTMRKRRRRAD
jgi:CheY-like chemotaxis protein/anti-sigma regulatory factor (Ser/Thr protein kinase)